MRVDRCDAGDEAGGDRLHRAGMLSDECPGRLPGRQQVLPRPGQFVRELVKTVAGRAG